MLPINNDGKHVSKIVAQTECVTHHAPTGIPCWHVNLDTVEGYGAAVCGIRIKKAGYNGKISDTALQKSGSRGGRKS